MNTLISAILVVSLLYGCQCQDNESGSDKDEETPTGARGEKNTDRRLYDPPGMSREEWEKRAVEVPVVRYMADTELPPDGPLTKPMSTRTLGRRRKTESSEDNSCTANSYTYNNGKKRKNKPGSGNKPLNIPPKRHKGGPNIPHGKLGPRINKANRRTGTGKKPSYMPEEGNLSSEEDIPPRRKRIPKRRTGGGKGLRTNTEDELASADLMEGEANDGKHPLRQAMWNAMIARIPPCTDKDLKKFDSVVQAIKNGNEENHPLLKKYREMAADKSPNNPLYGPLSMPFCLIRNEVYNNMVRHIRGQ